MSHLASLFKEISLANQCKLIIDEFKTLIIITLHSIFIEDMSSDHSFYLLMNVKQFNLLIIALNYIIIRILIDTDDDIALFINIIYH